LLGGKKMQQPTLTELMEQIKNTYPDGKWKTPPCIKKVMDVTTKDGKTVAVKAKCRWGKW
jgi:hypothetical protein